MTIDATTAYVVGVIFVATIIRSTIGFGEALVAVPLLSLRLPVAVAAPLAVIVSVVISGVIVAQDWREIDVRSAGWLSGSALLGIPLGVLLLTLAGDHLVKTLLGVIIVGFAGYAVAARPPRLERDHIVLLLGAGFVSGILGGAYGMNGPPLAVYGTWRRWSPQRFRATLQGYFLLASVAGLVGYAAAGLLRASLGAYVVVSLPSVLLGIVGGRTLNRRLQHEGFARLVYAGLIVIGGVLVAQGVSG